MSIPKLAGIETEFGITGGDRVRVSEEVVRAYPHISLDSDGAASEASEIETNPCVASFSMTDLMLPNGARFYVDHAHPEYSTPESSDPRVVVAADRAGAEIVWRCAEAVNRSSTQESPIRVYKNNSDHQGHSYGCHENYLLEASTYISLFGNKAHWIYAYLAPFLVSRIVFTGAGKVGAENGAESVAFQLAQRADFFECVVGLQTTHHRPIVNTRDEPHADATRFRRLHVIAGDANMCPYASWIKLGTMQILLRMLEDGALGGNLYLADPIKAIRQVSHDPTCRQKVKLEDGRELTAIEIQSSFLEFAKNYFERNSPTEAESEVMKGWEEVLRDLHEEPLRLAGKLDWVTKSQILAELAAQGGWNWESPQAHLADIQYHALDPEESIFHTLEKLDLIAAVPGTDDTAERYLREPPSDSRAYFRGGCIARFAPHIERVDWEELSFTGGVLSLPDPLAMGQGTTQPKLEQVRNLGELLEALKDSAITTDESRPQAQQHHDLTPGEENASTTHIG